MFQFIFMVHKNASSEKESAAINKKERSRINCELFNYYSSEAFTIFLQKSAQDELQISTTNYPQYVLFFYNV